MYWKADDDADDDLERERKWKVLLLYVCLHSNRLVQENFLLLLLLLLLRFTERRFLAS